MITGYKRPPHTAFPAASVVAASSSEATINKHDSTATPPPPPSSTTRKLPVGACVDVSRRYERIGRIGHGTYGIVYKARDRQTGKIVALKRCIPHHESSDGFPTTTLREINALRVCSAHPNVVSLLEVAVSSNTGARGALGEEENNGKSNAINSNGGVYLVFEHCKQDLAQIVDSQYPKHRRSPFRESHVKTLLQQLLSALEFCHLRSILHRDIKLSNLLYSTEGLKLADFGLSRPSSLQPMTPNVASLWYRPPELLFMKPKSSKETIRYTSIIDLWAAGCVFAELLQGVPLLDGKNEIDQISKMIECLGPPPPHLYPETIVPFSSYREHAFSPKRRRQERLNLLDQFSFLHSDGLTLMAKLLEYDPEKRWDASKALKSLYFSRIPYPAEADRMPRFSEIHTKK